MAKIAPSRFLSYRQKYHLTQAEMGNHLGVSDKYVGMIERGDKDVSDDGPLGLLFRVLESAPSKDSEADQTAVIQGGCAKYRHNEPKMIPVIGWAHAGEAANYEELPDSWKCKIPTECQDETAFAVSLEGDSMEPKFGEGDLLVVQPSEEPYSGCFVVARFVDDGVIFRRLEMAGKKIRLVALNPRYEVTLHEPEEFSWIYPVWGRWTQIWKRR